MGKQSAGILLYRFREGKMEIFLLHPGGPFWAKKDEGAWSIPKGEFEEGEDPLEVAIREFEEETGQKISGDFKLLQPVKQKGGKIIYAWAVEGEADANSITSNTFEMEWPPKSGRISVFPEVDKAAWFKVEEAKKKINEKQAELIEELEKRKVNKIS